MNIFEIKKFNSGEYSVKLNEIKKIPDEIHWNWFIEPDVMIPLIKADAARAVFGEIELCLNSPYLPYSRQDRQFELGNGFPLDVLLDLLKTRFNSILCFSAHNELPIKRKFDKSFFSYCKIIDNVIPVFPDENAENHFLRNGNIQPIYFEKERSSSGVKLSLKMGYLPREPKNKKYLICDDICDGGRTFTECAKILIKTFGKEINIELLVVHGFMTYGLDDLKSSGISRIWIANPDSYEYLTEKFNNPEYIQLWSEK